ncbi:MAG: SMODS domain-containing nucleotidyltransferase [Candidatus Saccharimonadales bacterium]
MTDEAINQVVNKYVKDNLSPKPAQRDFITEKYEELRGFLGGRCFQSGSYARYTAIDPVHDLDVIYPVSDASVKDNPSLLLRNLLANLQLKYKNSTTKIKRIYAQTHSVTIEFEGSPEETFSIDVVPAIELAEKNDYEQPLYQVPEIVKLNKHNREERYKNASTNPIGWIKSDPRGYVQAAYELNDLNANFRHATKLLKGWRHACKIAYGDSFRLKSFHLEQIVYAYFVENPGCTTVEAVIDCLAALPGDINEPQFTDRADATRYIDEYVAGLSRDERQLILRLQAEAFSCVRQIPASTDEQAIIHCLESLITVDKQSSMTPVFAAPSPRSVAPHQPWAC